MSTRSVQVGRPVGRSTGGRAGAHSGGRGDVTASAPGAPWTTQMYLIYGVLALIGMVLFLVGVGVVGDKKTYDDQVPGINLAIVGVVLANAAGVLLLLSGRRAVTARRVRVLGVVPVAQSAASAASAPASSTSLVGSDGLAHFHRADCVMADGRDWAELDRAAHEHAGRTACGVCKP